MIDGLPRWHSGKNLPGNAGDIRDVSSVPGLKTPGVGYGDSTPVFLSVPMVRGA